MSIAVGKALAGIDSQTLQTSCVLKTLQYTLADRRDTATVAGEAKEGLEEM